MIKLLAISGSLRQFSSNTALLRAAAILAPQNVKISIYQDLSRLPHFNPDLEGFEPQSVMDLRSQLRMADGIVIASPEYAHGIPGVMKNALDWVVGSGEFVHKPVALLNASFRAIHAQDSLREILKTMDAVIVPEASKIIPLPNNKINEAGIIANPELSSLLHFAIVALACFIKPEICSSTL